MPDICEFLHFSPPIISVAAYYQARKCFKYLLKHGASIHLMDRFRNPVSFYAAAGGSTKILKQLQKNGAYFGLAVFAAIENSQLKAIKWLFENRYFTNLDVDLRGYSLVNVALEIDKDDISIIEYLVNIVHCSLIPRKNDISLFFNTMEKDKLKISQFIASNPMFNPNEKDKEGNTPLHLACQKGSLEIVEAILSHKKCVADTKNVFLLLSIEFYSF